MPELLIRRGDQAPIQAAKGAELNWQPLGCKATVRGAFLMSVAFRGKADMAYCSANVR